MAYEKTTWAKGDVVTSAKLNKLEQGVEDAGKYVKIIAVHITDEAVVDIKPCDVMSDDGSTILAYPIFIDLSSESGGSVGRPTEIGIYLNDDTSEPTYFISCSLNCYIGTTSYDGYFEIMG